MMPPFYFEASKEFLNAGEWLIKPPPDVDKKTALFLALFTVLTRFCSYLVGLFTVLPR
jgi:hypothetical protein